MEYGIIVLLPPIATVLLAMITKRPWEPLIAGTLLAYLISDGLFFFPAWLEGLYAVFDADGVWLMLCLGLIGVFGIIIEESKGVYGMGNLIRRIARTEKQTLLAAWLLGIVMFIDDYANALTVSSTIKPVSDPQKTPRELLAYVTNSTAAPVCIIVPLSSWYVFFGGLFNKEECLKSFADGFSIYKGAIPYMFYGWLALIIVLFVILGVIPKVWKMKSAYERAKETGDIFSKASQKYNLQTAEEAVQVKDGNPWNFIVPMLIVVGLTLWTGDLLIGLMAAIVAAGILFIINKTMTFYEWVDIGLAEYVVSNVSPLMNATTFPVIVFILVGLLAFCTGNNWGVPAITIPMVAPLAVSCGADIYVSMGALLSGAAFGCHACFFSDTTVLTAKCCGISNMEHALTQLPYAVFAAVLSALLYVMAGMIL